ncbi:Uncharacterised protein [Halioglobus japonicus]|nr:Uncharacterised protein [Halioglobus japonicus]
MRADYEGAKREALGVLSQFGVNDPAIDPVEISRQLGANVHFVTFSGDYSRISGFYDSEEDAIFVNEKEHPLRQTFTIAHELGHRTMHREWAASNDYVVMMRDDTTSNDAHEIEANEFAGNLLVPRFLLDKYYESLTKSDLSRLFAVSVPVISVRLSREYGL